MVQNLSRLIYLYYVLLSKFYFALKNAYLRNLENEENGYIVTLFNEGR